MVFEGGALSGFHWGFEFAGDVRFCRTASTAGTDAGGIDFSMDGLPLGQRHNCGKRSPAMLSQLSSGRFFIRHDAAYMGLQCRDYARRGRRWTIPAGEGSLRERDRLNLWTFVCQCSGGLDRLFLVGNGTAW